MMKMRNILYVSLVLLIAGCSNEENFSDTLSGNGKKTPLLINATLDTGKGLTRASGGAFANGDVLKAYFRHLNEDDVIDPDYGKKLVTITKTSTGFSTDSYWDDFSNSSSTTTDIRTENHSLQSFYGYCYNEGSPSTALTETTGVLGWTVQTNQSTADAFRHSDILWSPTQIKKSYIHGASNVDDHGTFTLPFTHAMSEITVTVKTNEGFEGSTDGSNKPLDNAQLTLFKMGTVTTLTAPTSTWTPVPGTEDANIQSITMCGGPYSDYSSTNNFKDRNYTAIVAPGTKLKQGEKLLEIRNADGNHYSVTITSDMLDNATGWGLNHPAPKQGEEDSKKYVLTQPGYNYHLTVTVDKASLQTNATLNNWTDVTASGIGDILLNDDDTNLIMDDSDVPYGGTDVKVVAVDKNQFKSGDPAASFTLFTLLSTSSNGDASARTNESYNFATVSTYKDNGGDNNDEWVNSPEIYWPNVTDNYYFRALASFKSSSIVDGITVNDIANVGTDKATAVAVSQGTIAESKDILWGTSASHRGYNSIHYVRGQAIPPRIGGVPIFFSHAMSKVSFTLETTSVDATKVDLADASFVVSNLYTSGTITIENGVINGSGDRTASAISASVAHEFTGTSTNLITDHIVVPQTFLATAYVTVTLSNGAVYRVALKDCTLSDDNTATAWERGKNYSYTIHIEKEAVQFHALVKDWDVVNGSGNAALEWY